MVLTMLDGRTKLGVQVVEEVKKFFAQKVYATIIPRNVRLGEAPSFGASPSICTIPAPRARWRMRAWQTNF